MALSRGVDISSAQRITDWHAVARALDFVIVKASEGRSFVSPTWSRYFRAARDAKILRGSYHYAHPGKNSPVTEARHYVRQLTGQGWRTGYDLPPALDLEETEGLSRDELTNWALAFLREVDGKLGLTAPWLKTGVYLNNDYLHNRTHGDRVVDGRWKWLADWPVRNSVWPGPTGLPRQNAAVWQFTDRMHVDGIANGVDGDVARLEDLHNLAPLFYNVRPEPVPPPAPKPPAPQPKPPVPPQVEGDPTEMFPPYHYGIDKTATLAAGPARAIPWDQDYAGDPLDSREAGSPWYVHKQPAGIVRHELSSLRVTGAKGDSLQLWLRRTNKGGDVTFNKIIQDFPLSGGGQWLSATRTLTAAPGDRFAWFLELIGGPEGQGIMLTDGDWNITGWRA